MPTTQRGRVKKLKRENGYGFILPLDGGKDVFFHARDCTTAFDTIEENATVTFQTRESERGLQATNVEVVSAASA